MTDKAWVYIGLLVPICWYTPVLYELNELAPAISAYDALGENAQATLERNVMLLSSSIYDMHVILLVCIGVSLKSSRSSPIQLKYLHIGVTSAFCLMYMATWTEMHRLIPGSYSIYDVMGFILIAWCVYILRIEIKRVSKPAEVS